MNDVTTELYRFFAHFAGFTFLYFVLILSRNYFMLKRVKKTNPELYEKYVQSLYDDKSK